MSVSAKNVMLCVYFKYALIINLIALLAFCMRINLLANSPTFLYSSDTLYSVWCARGLRRRVVQFRIVTSAS